jgi:hypothetical protein
VALLQARGREKALIYMCEYFQCRGVPMPFGRRRIRKLARQDTANILDDPNLDHVCRVITGNERFFQDWCRARWLCPASADDDQVVHAPTTEVASCR